MKNLLDSLTLLYAEHEEGTQQQTGLQFCPPYPWFPCDGTATGQTAWTVTRSFYVPPETAEKMANACCGDSKKK